MREITYHKEGDYLIPDLIMKNSYEDYHIGKYGRLRLNYIKKYKRGLYTELMINGTLSKHLADIENAANERFGFLFYYKDQVHFPLADIPGIHIRKL